VKNKGRHDTDYVGVRKGDKIEDTVKSFTKERLSRIAISPETIEEGQKRPELSMRMRMILLGIENNRK